MASGLSPEQIRAYLAAGCQCGDCGTFVEARTAVIYVTARLSDVLCVPCDEKQKREVLEEGRGEP